jgi:hypothetical protein
MEIKDFFNAGLIKEHSLLIEKDVFQTSVLTLINQHKKRINCELITRLDDIAFIENDEKRNTEINKFFEEILEHKKSSEDDADESEMLII